MSSLSARERQVIRAVIKGATNRQVSERLGVREQTVKNQLSVIYEKLQLRNRVELAMYAVRHGLAQ